MVMLNRYLLEYLNDRDKPIVQWKLHDPNLRNLLHEYDLHSNPLNS